MRFPEMKSKRILKICCAAALVVLIFAALGPGKWQPRTGLGWQIDHVVGYFAFTLLFCLAWPRPLVIGAALIALAGLLEALQALTPDRSSNFFAALYSASGVLAAAVSAELFIRARRWFQSKRAETT
jgi:VanZ family protein